MAPIIRAPQTLLVRDNYVRRSSTNFGNLVADILAGQLKEPTSRRDIGIINSGSFRIDRNIESTVKNVFRADLGEAWRQEGASQDQQQGAQ
jgi:5'-nucleotidase, C-terminal domain